MLTMRFVAIIKHPELEGASSLIPKSKDGEGFLPRRFKTKISKKTAFAFRCRSRLIPVKAMPSSIIEEPESGTEGIVDTPVKPKVSSK